MRIPHIIYENTIIAYEVPDIYLRKEQLKGDDFTWDSGLILTLRESCLQIIAVNWEKNPIYKELVMLADRIYLLEILSTDLPLKLTVSIIEDDYYWQRCFTARWPNSPPPYRKLKLNKPNNCLSHFKTIALKSAVNNQNSKTSLNKYVDKASYISSEKEIHVFSFISDDSISDTKTKQTRQIEPAHRNHLVSCKTLVKSWKQCFLEKFFEEEIENMKPDKFNVEYIKELADLYGEYILSLNIKELRPCKNQESSDHISLKTLLSFLPNLLEFSVCFNKANLVDNFTWHSLKVSESDCELLGSGMENSQIKILRIIRSDIDCSKVKLIMRHLCENTHLRVLDLSHCKISDEGAKAIGGMLMKNNFLEKLVLVNNKIGAIGAQALSYYLCQNECKLLELNLKMNPLTADGGNYIATALVRGAHTLINLNVSSCGLTNKNLGFGLCFKLNNTLQNLDLSNNLLGEESGSFFLTGLEKNLSLLHIDLRMTGLLPEDIEKIVSKVKANLKMVRRILKTPPSAEYIL